MSTLYSANSGKIKELRTSGMDKNTRKILAKELNILPIIFSIKILKPQLLQLS